MCKTLGVGDPSAMRRRVLASVGSYADLAPALVGAVERLIDGRVKCCGLATFRRPERSGRQVVRPNGTSMARIVRHKAGR